MRVIFGKGDQRDFLKKVLINSNCPSLKELINRGFDVNYSTLKNYFNESRSLPYELFKDLCIFSGIDEAFLDFELFEDSWGQSKGGKAFKKN